MSRRTGLTLAEACLSLAVLAVAYLPLAELFRLTTAQTVKSRNALIAQGMAQTIFEIFRLRPNDLIYAMNGSSTANLLTDAEWRDRLTGKAPEIEEVLKVAEFKLAVDTKPADAKLVGLDRLDLTFSWKEGGNQISKKFARLIMR